MNVALIGTGLVGKAVLDQINQIPGFNVIAIANSRFILRGSSLSKTDIQRMEDGQSISVDVLLQLPVDTIVIDCTASDQVPQYYTKLMNKGMRVVTANKKGLSAGQELFDEIFSANGHFFHESTVGAGLPIISTLNDLLATKDEVLKIEGVLSGTLSYVFNEFCRSDRKFSQIIKVAKSLGYTEPDPRDDLNGMDVGRKVSILARLCGMKTFIGQGSGIQVQIQSLVPESLQSVASVDEFMRRLPEEVDFKFDQMKQAGKVLRYVGLVDLKAGVIKTELQVLNGSHPLASLEASDNMVIFWTKRYGNRPLVITGAGAGAEVTAHGVVADVIRCSKLK